MQPSKLVKSPKSHSTKKNMLNPDVECKVQFLYICGICAKSHDAMLKQPSSVETKANGVGIQVWKVRENWAKNHPDGSQWAGSEGSKIAIRDGMLSEKKNT